MRSIACGGAKIFVQLADLDAADDGADCGANKRQQRRLLLLVTNHDSLFTSVFGAVSSVVEHLVYTERAGGSKPSPPSFWLRIAGCRLVGRVKSLKRSIVNRSGASRGNSEGNREQAI
jgi:hypothetical protein